MGMICAGCGRRAAESLCPACARQLRRLEPSFCTLQKESPAQGGQIPGRAEPKFGGNKGMTTSYIIKQFLATIVMAVVMGVCIATFLSTLRDYVDSQYQTGIPPEVAAEFNRK